MLDEISWTLLLLLLMLLLLVLLLLLHHHHLIIIRDRIQRLEAASTNGTICLGAAAGGKEAVVDRCREWLSSSQGSWPPPEDLEPWLSSVAAANGRRVRLDDCAALGAAIDEACGFDSDAIEAFTKETLANGEAKEPTAKQKSPSRKGRAVWRNFCVCVTPRELVWRKLRHTRAQNTTGLILVERSPMYVSLQPPQEP